VVLGLTLRWLLVPLLVQQRLRKVALHLRRAPQLRALQRQLVVLLRKLLLLLVRLLLTSLSCMVIPLPLQATSPLLLH
jgi:hypothetical protein